MEIAAHHSENPGLEAECYDGIGFEGRAQVCSLCEKQSEIAI